MNNMDKYQDTKILMKPPPKLESWKGPPVQWVVPAILIILIASLPVIWYFYTKDMKTETETNVFNWEFYKFPERNHGSLVETETIVLHQAKPDYSESLISNKKCSGIEDNFRFDCHPENGASREKCEARGCCWVPPKKRRPKTEYSLGVPVCFYPENYPSYYLVNKTERPGYVSAYLARNGSSYYPNDVQLLKWETVVENEYRVRTKIYDPVVARYEIPYTLNPPSNDGIPAETLFEIVIKDSLSLEIKHKISGKTLFSLNTLGGFIYTDQFIQISGQLGGRYVYGLGERRDRFLRSTDWQRFTMHANGQHPVSNSNLYGSHPFMLVADDNPESANVGVLLYNSNAMDIILQPTPAFTVRTTGGILDFLTIISPNPTDVVSQYMKAVGLPFMPPYWSLGFHLSRYGYNSSTETRRVWENTRKAGIPFDVQWNDIDYMDKRRDFTYDKENYSDLPQFVDDIHKAGMHYVAIIDAALDTPKDPSSYSPYAEALEKGLLINDTNGNPFIGQVWSDNGAVWPDFTNPKTTDFWTDQVKKLYDQIPIDGLWIDMNEPTNFYNSTKTDCPTDSTYENPPYVPAIAGGKLNYSTLCMTSRQYAGIHYNVHNLYGLSESIATYKALKSVRPSKRPFIISRSTFPGQGHYGGHWSGDISSTWDDMKKSIPAILDFNLFGIPMVGADICGFTGNASINLCQRWMQLGAFYPFSRNHNDITSIAQDPVSMGEAVVNASRYALSVRYAFLPYFYTLFYRSHVYGETVARPLFFEFPRDAKTYPIDTQFMLGPALMVLPTLEENVTTIHSYFPAGRWYRSENLTYLDSLGGFYDTPVLPEFINFALRGGYIIPVKENVSTTTESRKAAFKLTVALDSIGGAIGELYWDDGESPDVIEEGKFNLITFTAHSKTIESTVVKLGAPEELTNVEEIIVYGVDNIPKSVSVDGEEVKFEYDETIKAWWSSNFSISLLKPFKITWS